VGALVCAAIALQAILDVEDYAEDEGGEFEFEDADLYKSGAAWLILTGAVGAFVEIIITILRLCNLSCCSDNSFACGVLVGLLACAFMYHAYIIKFQKCSARTFKYP